MEEEHSVEPGSDRTAELSRQAPGPVDPSNEDLDWSVGRVAERLGVPPATLRTWDRRYGIGPSQRTSGGHRRYSEEDIRRVRVMARFIDRGVPAQTAARVASSMDTDRLRIETEVDQPTEVYAHAALVTAISSAALTLNPEALSRLYQLTLRERDLVGAWTDVFCPALQLIGSQWGKGAIGVESEHLASELLVTELRALIAANRPPQLANAVVLAGADDEQHYLPLLALQAELYQRGVGASYLGPRTPSPALVELLHNQRPERVFLWASLERPANEPFWAALKGVEHPVTVVLGGPGWPVTTPPVPRHVTVLRAEDLASAADLLAGGRGRH